MRRRTLIEPRRVILIGVEGESERAFAQFLQRCCDQAGLHLHLNIRLTRGGDSVSVVEETGRHLSRQAGRREISGRLVLLDRDRIEEDLRAGRDARAVASRWKLQLVFQDSNLEGLLCRLHPGRERRRMAARAALEELRKCWPDYVKAPTVDQLSQRFRLSDLRRAAQHDRELRRLLAVLGL